MNHSPHHLVAFRVLTVDQKGWNRVWGRIEKKYGPVAAGPATGEQWMYIGSTLKGETFVHEFRHLSLKGRRAYETVAGQDDDFDPVPTRFSRVRLRTANKV